MAPLTLLLIVLEICVAVRSEVELQKRIIGGQPCNNNERLYHVKLTAKNHTHESLCGGSLISDQWVLTAAHCWVHEPGWSHKAVVRVHPGRGKKLTIKANPVIYTDQNNNQHDIMLLKLPKKIRKITPVQLPNCNNRLNVGAKVQIAGFGPTSLGPNEFGPPSKDLQCADFDIVDCNTVRKLSRNPGNANQRRFCVQSPGLRTCPGDSGGGAIYNNMIYGVHVTGRKVNACNVYATEMDVCEYEAWIMQTINP